MIDLVITHLDHHWGPPWWFDALKSIPVIHFGHFRNAPKWPISPKVTIFKHFGNGQNVSLELTTEFSASNHQWWPWWVRTKYQPNKLTLFRHDMQDLIISTCFLVFLPYGLSKGEVGVSSLKNRIFIMINRWWQWTSADVIRPLGQQGLRQTTKEGKQLTLLRGGVLGLVG